MASHGDETAEARIAMAVELFSVGEGAFDSLLTPLVDALAPRGQPMGIGALARICPDMTGDEAGCAGARRA